MKIFQLNIFNEREEITHKSTNYADFVKKFERKKTTDDCYTPEAVYNAIIQYIDNNIIDLEGKIIKRPFFPNGDYLAEKYDNKTIVIDNPPFSIYSKIVRNYMRMNVKFFLFAPALMLFVPRSNCSYVITNSNIRYNNGAVVKTSFATNLIGGKILISATLSNYIKVAQQQTNKEKKDMRLPENYINSAQLIKYCKNKDLMLQGSEDFLTKFEGRKIFGAAMRLTDKDINLLKS